MFSCFNIPEHISLVYVNAHMRTHNMCKRYAQSQLTTHNLSYPWAECISKFCVCSFLFYFLLILFSIVAFMLLLLLLSVSFSELLCHWRLTSISCFCFTLYNSDTKSIARETNCCKGGEEINSLLVKSNGKSIDALKVIPHYSRVKVVNVT